MGRNAKIRKQRKAAFIEKRKIASATFKSNLDVEFAPQLLQYFLTHQLTKDWVISQWNLFLANRPFISPHQQSVVASKLLSSLFQQSQNEYGLDVRVELPLQDPPLDLAIGLNFDNLTLWVGIQERLTNTIFLTPDDAQFQLRQIPS
jgi:hypothetical protein